MATGATDIVNIDIFVLFTTTMNYEYNYNNDNDRHREMKKTSHRDVYGDILRKYETENVVFFF